MVERVIPGWRREVRQASGDRAGRVRSLSGIGDIDLLASPEPRRAQRELIAFNQRPRDGDRQKDVRVADRVVVEEVLRLGAKVIHINRPAAYRYGEPHLVLLVALAAQWQKAQGAALCIGQEWPRNRLERRGLIELAPET